MIKLQMNLIRKGCADGHYIIKAKGFILAVLSWADKSGLLENWGAFAYVPIDPAGNGDFYFYGLRGIPREATHVYMRCFVPDFSSHEDSIYEIPEKFLNISNSQYSHKFSVLTDIHLSANKTRFKLKKALQMTQSDIILLLGDSVNDGLREQFTNFEECIRESAPEKIFFPVIGNHDVLHNSNNNGCENYSEFQGHMLERAVSQGFCIIHDKDSLAYSVKLEDINITGLQCVTSGRKFSFPEGRQILWLKEQLNSQKESSRQIILCHAPLLDHNPSRNTGNPYLGKNKMLQEVIDSFGRIIFLSGHTHISPNHQAGNLEIDNTHNNIYLNCASLVDTDIKINKNIIMPPDWNDGCITEIYISANEIEICTSSIKTGIKFPLGYYRL